MELNLAPQVYGYRPKITTAAGGAFGTTVAPMMMQQPMMVQQPMHGQRGSAPGDSNGAAMLVAGLAGGMVLGSLFD